MTRTDVLRMAREAGKVNCDCCLPRPFRHEMEKFLLCFAALVAAAEREECAKICDEGSSFDGDIIRARGKK